MSSKGLCPIIQSLPITSCSRLYFLPLYLLGFSERDALITLLSLPTLCAAATAKLVSLHMPTLSCRDQWIDYPLPL